MSRTISSGEPVHDVGDAEVLLGRIDEHRSEMDAREEGFNKVMEAGERMIDNGHFAADEVSGFFLFSIICPFSAIVVDPPQDSVKACSNALYTHYTRTRLCMIDIV